MTQLLVLPWLQVENANTVAGLTWGFPAISHFLGYVHALSRKLTVSHGLSLEGCGVICHAHQVHAYSSGRDYQFALTRNPLTREGRTASFNEEGRMHMTISLLVECHGQITQGDAGRRALEQHLTTLCQTQKLAGGTITAMRHARIYSRVSEEKQWRSLCYRLMPGFALVDRSTLLEAHYHRLKQQNSATEMLDAWLDFATLKMKSQEQSGEIAWQYLPAPEAGYLVPIMTGWQRISQLYASGSVANARDNDTPFCFAEAVYGVGEWRSPHRISSAESLLWRYHTTASGYYCRGQEVGDDQQTEEPIIFDDI